MAPFDLTADWGSLTSYLTAILIGVGFGATLEASGFGDSRKLAAQFYLTDMTVLKVMFTGIVVASVLLGVGSTFGLVDMSRVWVNPTYLMPGVVGGLIMGVGFAIGGFCPGTSAVAASTLKLDGIFFAVGVSFGIFAFGESVSSFEEFFFSTSMGRYTLADLFNVDTGVVLVAVVALALAMFLGAQLSESFFGAGKPVSELRLFPQRRTAYVFAAVLMVPALVAMGRGEPTAEEKWERIAAVEQPKITSRSVFVHPLEVAEVVRNTDVYTRIIDVRSESDYNLFHLRRAQRATLQELTEPTLATALREAPRNTVYFAVSNDESAATEAWKILRAQGAVNAYIVEGGMNRWLDVFPPPRCLATEVSAPSMRAEETLAFAFKRAVGDCCDAAFPTLAHQRLPADCYLATGADDQAHSRAGTKQPEAPVEAFERKVKLEARKGMSGGCG